MIVTNDGYVAVAFSRSSISSAGPASKCVIVRYAPPTSKIAIMGRIAAMWNIGSGDQNRSLPVS